MYFPLVYLSPLVWFKFYSWDDLGTINITITWKQWATEKSFQKYLPELEKTIWDTKDLKSYSLTTSWNKIKIDVNVVKKDERTQEIEKTENEITSSLNFMVSHGFDVTVATQSNWPPGSGWALWVKLVSTNASKLEELKKVSDDFEKFFKSLKRGTLLLPKVTKIFPSSFSTYSIKSFISSKFSLQSVSTTEIIFGITSPALFMKTVSPIFTHKFFTSS